MYPGDIRDIEIVFCIDEGEVEYFDLGVHPIFRDIYHFGSAIIENEKKFPAKIAPVYNLPCDYVIHTVGPIVCGKLTKEHERLLKSCYESCLKIADEYKKNYDSDIKVVYNVFKEEDEELYELVKNKDYFLPNGNLIGSQDKKTKENRYIPSGLVPKCPHCGRTMTMNLRADETFVEDEGCIRRQKGTKIFFGREKTVRFCFWNWVWWRSE